MKHNALVGLLMLPLVAQDVRRSSDDAPVFRDDAKFIMVDVQVLANDRPVVGLTKQNFQVFDDGEPQDVASLDFDEAPLDIMLLVDVSSSTDQVASEMEDQSAEAMYHLKRHDRIGLAVFAWSAYLAVPITADRDQLEAGIFKTKSWRFPPAVRTELNATTLDVAEYLRKNARPGARRAIIVLTDNNGTRVVPDEKVRDGLWEADALLSTIFFRGGRFRPTAR
ncbi:MAG: VWA domain-containing protein [Bryobacteraceae bacterium]|jgi:VWFA-related protein